MLELKTIDIYAKDRVEPSISITYTLKDKERHLDMFKMWVREDLKCNYEILNFANLLYYQVMVFENQPQEKHIFRAYQMLFANHLWENYKDYTSYVFAESTLRIKPHRNFVEYTKDYMKDFVESEIKKYMQRAVESKGVLQHECNK